MSVRKIQQDPVTGHIKQSTLDVILGVPIVYVLLILMAVFIPEYKPNNWYVSTLLLIGIIGIGASVWLNAFPNLLAKFLKFSSLASLWGVISYRSFAYLFPKYSLAFGILITATVIFTQVFPNQNPKITSLIRNELYTPKSKFGKYASKIAIAILPLAGCLGASVEVLSRPIHDQFAIIALILGPLGWFNALILPFATQHPASPWERKK